MNGERFPVFSYLSQKGGDILVRSDFSCLRPRENNGRIIPGSPFFIQINFPAAAGRAVLQTAQIVHFYTQFSSRRRPALFPARHRVPSKRAARITPRFPRRLHRFIHTLYTAYTVPPSVSLFPTRRSASISRSRRGNAERTAAPAGGVPCFRLRSNAAERVQNSADKLQDRVSECRNFIRKVKS